MELKKEKAAYFLAFVLVIGVTIFSGCDNKSTESSGVIDTPKATTTETITEEPKDTIVLVERNFSDGRFTCSMPLDWSDYEPDTIFRKSGEPFITTFKYRSVADSGSAVGVSYGINDNVPQQYLGKFVANLEEEARQQTNLRKIDKQFLKLQETRETGVITYSLWDGTAEIDLSVIAAAVVDNNILTFNIYFKGPVTPQQEDAARLMVRSFKMNTP